VPWLLLLLLVSGLLEIAAERLEALLPELPIVSDPVGGGPQRAALQPAVVDASVARARQQAGSLEHAQVARDRGEGDGERARELRHRDVRRLREPRQDRAAGRVRERAEGGVQRRDGRGGLRHS
jgi:hypothetical protein